MPDGYQAVSYPDMQNLFTLGGSAVYPAGSWEISIFNELVGDDFAIGAFPPPVPEEGADCFINDHMDMGMGMNANTQHPEEAQLFLEWLGSAEFAELWNNALPGFFAMSNHVVEGVRPDGASVCRLAAALRFVTAQRLCHPLARRTQHRQRADSRDATRHEWRNDA